MKKISEWLNDLDSHLIYAYESLSKDFKDATGEDPCWPVHNVDSVKKDIDARGLGGSLEAKVAEKLCYGWEIAEALARKYSKYNSGYIQGRGTRFDLALTTLENAGY